jgi:hypothetical protein
MAADCETQLRYHAGQMDHCEAAARRGTRIARETGDVWLRANIEFGLFIPPLYCGRPAEAERLILEAIPRMTRVGHDDAKLAALCHLASVHIAKGDLESAERKAREALAFGESSHAGWIFLAEASLGGILLYRDRTAEALSLLTKAAGGPAKFFSGFPDGLLALAMTATGTEDAGRACDEAMQLLPRPGTSRSLGAWNAVLSVTEALCLAGRRQEAAGLQGEAEKIAGEWESTAFGFPVRTAAGIAAACARNWDRAEAHHRDAIARMEAAPYVTAQSIGRYWYADMLAERRHAGDIHAARSLLRETIAAGESIGLALYARLARRKLARI